MPLMFVGTIASNNQAGRAAGSYESISSTSLANSTTASVTLGSIPQTYTHLELVISGKLTASGWNSIRTRVNSINTSVYTKNQYGTSGSTFFQETPATSSVLDLDRFMSNSDGVETNGISSIKLYIPNYTDSGRNKLMYGFGTRVFNFDSGSLSFYSVSVNTPHAVTSLTFSSVFNFFETGTQFSLYGIKE
jgi:hypothetical protein